AMAAASLQVAVPRSLLDAVAGHQALAVVALAGLAVVLAICSEADAFVAASLSQFSLTARLVFMVVGPVVDLKLVALQTGVFGRRFTLRFAPLTPPSLWPWPSSRAVSLDGGCCERPTQPGRDRIHRRDHGAVLGSQ